MTGDPVRPAVVLVSGGLDSATCLAMARAEGFACYALSFHYGQRHPAELVAFGGSALTDIGIAVPEGGADAGGPGGSAIPVTYVPARNTVFLALALAWAEVLHAHDIFIGVNAVDYSGYPDCRPQFIAAFEAMANLATRAGVEERVPLHIRTPLIELSKAEIVRRGIALGVDFSLTVSCYQADDRGRACGRCDSCRLRKAGFVNAGVADPTSYA